MDTNQIKLYRSVDVWVRLESDRVACYRCLKILPGGGYVAQGKDFFTLPVAASASFLERQFVTLLAEIAPEERGGEYPTLEQAIAAHERELG